MSDNNTGLGARLQTLRDQIAGMIERRRALGADATPDTTRPGEWVKTRAAATAEIAAIDDMLPALQAEEAAAAAQLAEAAREQKAAAAAAMREDLTPLLRDVVAAVDQLDVALARLESQELAIRQLGSWVPATYSGLLRNALVSARGSWRRDWPGLVGVPPATDKKAAALAEARREVARLIELREAAIARGDGPMGVLATDNKKLVASYDAALSSARQRVKELEGAGKAAGGKAVPGKRAPRNGVMNAEWEPE